MTHNPIIEVRKLKRLEGPIIEPGTRGLLYQNGRYVRTLDPGEELSTSVTFAYAHIVW